MGVMDPPVDCALDDLCLLLLYQGSQQAVHAGVCPFEDWLRRSLMVGLGKQQSVLQHHIHTVLVNMKTWLGPCEIMFLLHQDGLMPVQGC